MKVAWSPLAARQAQAAVAYIAGDRPDTAVEWLEELLERVALLELFEELGRVVPEIGLPAYREIPHKPYRIIYRVDASRVVILTLRHMRQDWDAVDVSNDV